MLAAIFVRGAFGAVYGALMMIGALVCAGFGHGTYLPAAIVAAPLSLIPVAGLFMAPVWWGILAALTSLQRRLPLFMLLAVHVVTVLCMLHFGPPMEPGPGAARLFDQGLLRLASWIRGTFVLYGSAVVAVLVVGAIRATAHSPDADDYLRKR